MLLYRNTIDKMVDKDGKDDINIQSDQCLSKKCLSARKSEH